MKTIFSVLLCLLLNTAQATDVYVVQQVKGDIVCAGAKVKPGDKLQASQQLTFGAGAMMLVSSQSFGSMVIKPAPQPGKTEIAHLLSELMPKQMRASTKSGAMLCSTSDFASFFGQGVFHVYGKRMNLEVCQSAYALNAQKFFYIACSSINPSQPGAQEEEMNFVLPSQGKGFVIGHSELMEAPSGSPQPILPNSVKLFYYNEATEESSEMAAFRLVFVGDESFEAEVKEAVSLLKEANASKKEILESVSNMAWQRFGHSDKDNLEEWLYRAFGIE